MIASLALNCTTPLDFNLWNPLITTFTLYHMHWKIVSEDRENIESVMKLSSKCSILTKVASIHDGKMGLKSFIGCKVRIKSKWQFQWGVFFVVLVVVVATSVKRGSSHNLINVLAVRCLLRSPQRISAISFPFLCLSNNLKYITYELLCLECKRHIQRKGLEKDFKVQI